jgi:methyl coenzyme M reductase subunit D
MTQTATSSRLAAMADQRARLSNRVEMIAAPQETNP